MKVTDIALRSLEAINTPYSLYLFLMVKYKVDEDVRTIDPTSYFSADQYLSDAQAYALVSKNFVLPKRDTEAAAIASLYASETQCKLTNSKFLSLDFTFRERSTLELAKAFCHKILRTVFIDTIDFGPGATTLLRGSDCNVITKLSVLPETTHYCYDAVVRNILTSMPGYAISSGMVYRSCAESSYQLAPKLATIVDADIYRSVPKNYKTDRGIFIGPSGQMLVQKGCGSAIRRRMKDFGYDLNTAPDLHAQLARQGSIDGSFATIDLASASDTISYELVRFMLPQDWFDLLISCRSRNASVNGSLIRYEKFSAMGNGYTFELESLIFLCLMLAVRSELKMSNTRVSVFGDDMICHPRVAYALLPLLTACGFKINLDKTFIEGPFRESCGHDFFNGIAVRPVYLRDKRDEHPTIALYYYANRIRKMAYVLNHGFGCDRRLLPIWKAVTSRVPRDFLHWGPPSCGDNVVHSERDPWRGKRRRPVIEKKSRYFNKFSNSDHQLSCALYGVPSKGVIPRGVKYSLKTKWLVCHIDDELFYNWI